MQGFGPNLPKGPFCTKNTTEPESVVFCYRCSSALSVAICCQFALGKQTLLKPLRSVLLYRHSEFSLRSEFTLGSLFSTGGSFG